MTENTPNNEAPEISTPTTTEEPTLRDAMMESYQELKSDAPEGEPEKQINQDDKIATPGSDEEKVQSPTPIQAPTSWSDEDKTVFSKLPPDAQNVIMRRESERDNYLQQQSRQFNHLKQEMDGLGSVLTPVKHIMDQNNVGVPELIKEYVNLHTLSERDPLAYLNLFAQSKGIDLKQLVSGQLDPTKFNQQALQSKISELETKLNQVTNKDEQQGNIYAQTEVEKFKADPANKFVDKVSDDMALLLSNDKAKDLPDAYNKACRMNPEIWAEIEKENAKNKAKEQNDKALNAKKNAGTRLKTKEMSTISPPASTNIRETMKEVYRELNEGTAA